MIPVQANAHLKAKLGEDAQQIESILESEQGEKFVGQVVAVVRKLLE